MKFGRITFDPQILGGRAAIRGMRILYAQRIVAHDRVDLTLDRATDPRDPRLPPSS